MSQKKENPSTKLNRWWNLLSRFPAGRWIFSKLLGLMVPYTRSIRCTVVQFEPGYAEVLLHDRWRVRNHLRSVHAIALANLGELATGLSLIGGLSPRLRAILTGLDVRYTKKARGPLLAEARCTVPEIVSEVDHAVEATIRDSDGDTVAIVTAHWLLSPTPEQT
ncbi:MAG: hotdog fold domain-containing protein [Gemmatimonadota bacterium]|jgi:acyl-coenzyme A thioesterase PaaI-like protein|nr:hotdog fold domain-containing protein [Gemmatimonadota bacterium]